MAYSANEHSTSGPTPEEPRELGQGLLGGPAATALVAGSILGIGIFLMPPLVAGAVPHTGLFLALWLFGGISALCGALAVAELGAMLPSPGGDYPYLRRAYGPGFAFAAGWLQLLAVFPGSLASFAVGTSTFQLPILLGDVYTFGGALGPGAAPILWGTIIIVAITAINHIGIVISGRVQVVLATIPIAILFTAAIIVLFTFDAPLADPIGTPAPPAGAVTSRALAHGFLSVYFAYSGWNAAIYVGSEIRKPGRTLPRALLVGTGSVTALYMVMCAGFLAVFSIARLATVGEAGTAAARELLGARGELAITILIAVAILGSINGTVLTGSRVAFAMARSGHCPRSAGILDRRYGTPVVALWAQAGLSIALMGSQRFEQLIEYTAAAMLVTGTLTVMAVVVLRRKLADQPRPYRTWGYPVTPLVYAGSSVVVLLALVEDLDPSVFLALVWFAGALVVHRWWFHRGERPDEDPRARAVASSSDPG